MEISIVYQCQIQHMSKNNHCVSISRSAHDTVVGKNELPTGKQPSCQEQSRHILMTISMRFALLERVDGGGEAYSVILNV